LLRFTPAGNFVLRLWVEQEPATARLRSRSHNDDQVEVEAATEAVQPVSSLDRTTTTRSRSRLRPKRCSTKMSISAHRRCLHSTANSRARAAGLVHRAQPPGGCRGPSRKAVARACSRWAILVARLMVRPQYHSYPSGMSVPVRISNGSTPFNSSAE
jgi:hypothetical protein